VLASALAPHSLQLMRRCARMSCSDEPVATIALRYADLTILIGELRPERDPRLLDPALDTSGR